MIITVEGTLLLKMMFLHLPAWKSQRYRARVWCCIVLNQIPYETIFHRPNLSGYCIIHLLYLPSSIMQRKSLTIHTRGNEIPILIMRTLKMSVCLSQKQSPYLTDTWDRAAENGPEVIYSCRLWIWCFWQRIKQSACWSTLNAPNKWLLLTKKL